MEAFTATRIATLTSLNRSGRLTGPGRLPFLDRDVPGHEKTGTASRFCPQACPRRRWWKFILFILWRGRRRQGN